MDVIDKKAQHWHKLWTSSQDISMDTVSATFRRIKEATFPGDLPEITTNDIRGTLRRMKPRAGQGLDRLSPTDLDRLPDAALAAIAFVMVEESCKWPWPWQLPVLGRLLPRKSSGDRTIGLSPLPRAGAGTDAPLGTRPSRATQPSKKHSCER
eukprot:7719680-Pyramimonas_sp.AAC.1